MLLLLMLLLLLFHGVVATDVVDDAVATDVVGTCRFMILFSFVGICCLMLWKLFAIVGNNFLVADI